MLLLLITVLTLFTHNQLTSLELQYVSPKLLMCRDLELAVPGTYDPTTPVIHIHKVQGSLQVFLTKQRPRKLSIFGTSLLATTLFNVHVHVHVRELSCRSF